MGTRWSVIVFSAVHLRLYRRPRRRPEAVMARIPAHLLPHSRRPVGLVPESLLPDQYAQRGWRAAEGERRLLLAVLERAYLDLCGRAESKHQRHLVQGARGWVERDDESHPFTFH